ncbi:hypothetical protein H0B56_00070 [Haloechinothrix sp. YIM 98757]|uniref:ATP-grasp domain-containing protein n=1 Tax=Haloechinothrix aidingensis TaxID=2752311 RepID=A0A838A5H0_9PSEU|nr:hypothetical protein [Haloechinothrix aidingensis]MBA0123935.1 hypothetical protein [Haloechinothrix aidingensis]
MAADALSHGIPGLHRAGVDLLLPRGPGERDITVLEVNAAPMVTMQHWPWSGRPRNVAGALVGAILPDNTDA